MSTNPTSNLNQPNANRNKIAAILLLLFTAFIWGTCFVAQRAGMEYIGPFLFNGLRTVLGALTLLIVLLLMHLFNKAKKRAYKGKTEAQIKDSSLSTDNVGDADIADASVSTKRTVLIGGVICGIVLFVASNLQQIGMVSTPASKAAFITTLYIVLVPLVGIIFRNKTRWNTWISVAIAVIGLYLLCISETLTLAFGDSVLLLCALFWALHILFVGRFAPRLRQQDLMKLCIVQFSVTAVLSLVCALFLDGVFVPAPLTFAAIYEVLPEIAYAGILSTGVAFSLQAIGQKYAPPAPAAVIMSTESVFGLLGGVVLLHEVMAGREIVGCILMFAAVILAQLTFRRKKRGILSQTDVSGNSKTIATIKRRK